MSKNYFNDTSSPVAMFKLECSGCRVEITMLLNYYPHAQRKIITCPVCLQGKDGIKVVAIKPEV